MSKSRVSFPFSFLLSPSRSGHALARPPHSPLVPSRAYLSRASQLPQPQSRFSTASLNRRAAEATGQRYGTANEPPPHLSGNTTSTSNSDTPQKALPKTVSKQHATSSEAQQREKTSEPTTSESAGTAQEQDKQQKQTQEENEETEDGASKQTSPLSSSQQSSASPQTDTTSKEPDNLGNIDASALKTILGMDSLLESRAEKPPHLEPPQYTHHFDTYTLVRSLQEGGFSESEAVIVMKAVRASLADNMDLARDGLLSKGDAEMTAYQFRSACTELRTEMRNTRSAMGERMQSERNRLQHEVDVLSQRITADTSSLRDEQKEMFHDRKMAVRMERRDLENQIQEVNYKITTRLNSEMKSESEGLRWVLVRRTAISIAIVTATALVTLKMMQTAEKREAAKPPPETFSSAESFSPSS